MQDRKNILLVKGVSRYGSSDRYIDEWAASMRKLGCNTCILDGWSAAQPMFSSHVMSTHKFDAVIDINSVAYSWNIPRGLPPETLYGTYLCDPPVAFRQRYAEADERTIVFGCDQNFCNYIDRFYPMIRHTKFIPLSGSFYPVCEPYEKRPIDILFTGTYTNPEKYKEDMLNRFEAGSALAKFAEDMLNDIITHPQYTLPECLDRILKKNRITVSDGEFDELIGEFLNVDFYARFYYRDKVIRVLLNAGLQIHVFGNGWEDFDADNRQNLVIHTGGAYAAGKALANAKIALNIMPWFKDAFQERIASAMLSKSVAVTDESNYITTHFENDKELVIFSLTDLDSLAARIQYLLNHPQEAAKIAENGYRIAQNHTWHSRSYEMLRAMETEFGVSFIQDGEGRELELELDYPDQRTLTLDAVYELNKLAALADNDIGKIEKISSIDTAYLLEKFSYVARRFSNRLTEIEMNPYIESCMRSSIEDTLNHAVELFSMQCKALMSKLLLDISNISL